MGQWEGRTLGMGMGSSWLPSWPKSSRRFLISMERSATGRSVREVSQRGLMRKEVGWSKWWQRFRILCECRNAGYVPTVMVTSSLLVSLMVGTDMVTDAVGWLW